MHFQKVNFYFRTQDYYSEKEKWYVFKNNMVINYLICIQMFIPENAYVKQFYLFFNSQPFFTIAQFKFPSFFHHERKTHSKQIDIAHKNLNMNVL